uniref:Thiol oxidase n=1 Tax=Ditylenchus dipsaci TaxID=166011 RepID=A0A915EPR6_9BILA
MQSDNVLHQPSRSSYWQWLMNLHNQINSAVQLGYYRGFYDLPTLKNLTQCCMATPLQSDNETVQICGELAYNLGFLNVWETLNDAYNTYTDCYATPADSPLLAYRHQTVTTRQLKNHLAHPNKWFCPTLTILSIKRS